MKKIALLFLCGVCIYGFSFAQIDSLRRAKLLRGRTLVDTLQRTDTLPQTVPFVEPSEKKGNPFVGKNEVGRLQVQFALPGRKPVSFLIPKVLYAGPSEFPDPEVSWKRSLIVPGWGQIYNGDSWKLPIFYAGYTGLGWYYSDRNRAYGAYKRGYRIRVLERRDGIDPTPADLAFLEEEELINTAEDGLLRQRDQIRRQRDFAVLYLVGWHLIQVIESYVGGHMKSVDISEDLSLQISPTYIPIPQAGKGAVGMGLQWRF